MNPASFSQAFETLRHELLSYLTRLVIRRAVAEELVQETAVRALQRLDDLPERDEDLRPWLFRVATNLGIDYCRRRGIVRETLLVDARRIAESQGEKGLNFAARTRSLQGTPEMAAIAREHLVACFGCALGQFPAEQAAVLLLREVYDFSIDQIAEMLSARVPQAKNWLQQARAAMDERYGRTCALVTKQGVCHQCVELDGLYRAGKGDPLAGTPKSLDDRLRIVRELRASPDGTWERLLAELLDEAL